MLLLLSQVLWKHQQAQRNGIFSSSFRSFTSTLRRVNITLFLNAKQFLQVKRLLSYIIYLWHCIFHPTFQKKKKKCAKYFLFCFFFNFAYICISATSIEITVRVGKYIYIYFVCEWWWMAMACDPARVYFHWATQTQTHNHSLEIGFN